MDPWVKKKKGTAFTHSLGIGIGEGLVDDSIGQPVGKAFRAGQPVPWRSWEPVVDFPTRRLKVAFGRVVCKKRQCQIGDARELVYAPSILPCEERRRVRFAG